MPPLSTEEQALTGLLAALQQRDYRFVTPTPLTHSRVLARAGARQAQSLREALGWSLPFDEALLEPQLLALMRAARIVRETSAGLRSAIRVSSLDELLFAHSAYPTEAADAVFFGPDTYRFCRFVSANLGALASPQTTRRMVDIGAGSGAGGIVVARQLPQAQLLLTDINDTALSLARVNAAAAGIDAESLHSDVLADVPGLFDLVISNPPYLNDDARRAYRHGGGALGAGLSLRIADEALQRLRHGGVLLLYTGVAIVDGIDPFLRQLQALFASTPCDWHYAELDPDVFGEELLRPAYCEAERIAAAGLVAIKR